MRGTLALELFDTGTELLANEMAPRVHNSGHWTIEGAETSQFENHVRAVMGLPLGSTELRNPAVAMINLLGTNEREARVEHTLDALRSNDGHLHIYGKIESRPGRKMGQFTLLGDDLNETYAKAQKLAGSIQI